MYRKRMEKELRWNFQRKNCSIFIHRPNRFFGGSALGRGASFDALISAFVQLCALYIYIYIYLWCGIRATSLCSRIIRALKTISTIRQSTLLVPVRPRSAVLDCMCGYRSLQYILHRFRAFIITLEAAWQFYLVTFVQFGTVIYLSTRYIFNVHMQIMINLLLLYRESKRLTEITPTVIAAYFTDDINCVILAIWQRFRSMRSCFLNTMLFSF